MATKSFSAAIGDFCKKTKMRADTVIRKLAWDAYRGVLMESPVDTGRFRANWRISLNRTDLTFVAEAPESTPKHQEPPTSSEEAKHNFAMAKVKWGLSVVISNNVPYAPALEAGHSKQAPSGVLMITYERIVAGFAKIVEDVKKASGS